MHGTNNIKKTASLPSTWEIHFLCPYSRTARMKRDGTRAETRFGRSAKRTSPFKLAGVSLQSTTGSRVVRISGSNGSNAGYTMFWGTVQDYWLPTPFACFPFTSRTVCHRVPSGFNWALLPITQVCNSPTALVFSLWCVKNQSTPIT